MKILFVRFSSLGDCILTTGIIKFLKTNLPDAETAVLTSTDFAGVYAGLDFIDRVHQFDRKSGLKAYLKFIKDELAEYTHIIDLHSSVRSRLLKFFHKAEYFRYVKHSRERRKFVKTKKRTHELNIHVTEKYAKTLEKAFGLRYSSIEDLRPVIHIANNEKINKSVLLHPFASKKTKEWGKFPELAKQLADNGYYVTVAGIGQFPETDGINNLVNKTTLQGLFELMSSHEYVITTDSGPMHASVAMNTKTIAIFGCTTKEFGFAPIFKDCKIIENNDIKCRPCDVHGLDKCPLDHFDCMETITAENVFSVLKTF